MAFCQNCGAQFSEGAKFCPSCGTPVQAVEAPAPVQQEAVPRQWKHPRRYSRRRFPLWRQHRLLSRFRLPPLQR